MDRKRLFKILRARGWNVDIDNIDFRKQDVTLWYDFDSENPILQVSRNKDIVQLIAAGDIRITSERKCFIYKGGKPQGELTHYLRKHGEWGNNNWFEVNMNGSSYESFEEPYYDLEDAITNLLARIP